MNTETKNSPTPLVTADESIDMITDNTPFSVSASQYGQNERIKSEMLVTRKILIQQRLIRWCAFILSLGTIIIIWRYISILILAVWLSSICRPVLEWLVSHL